MNNVFWIILPELDLTFFSSEEMRKSSGKEMQAFIFSIILHVFLNLNFPYNYL